MRLEIPRNKEGKSNLSNRGNTSWFSRTRNLLLDLTVEGRVSSRTNSSSTLRTLRDMPRASQLPTRRTRLEGRKGNERSEFQRNGTSSRLLIEGDRRRMHHLSILQISMSESGYSIHSRRETDYPLALRLSWMCRSSFGYQAGPFSLDIVSISAMRRSTRDGLMGFARRIWTRFLNFFSQVGSFCIGRRNGSIRLD